MKQAHHYTTSQMIRRVLREHIAPYKMRIFIALVCMLLSAAMTATQAWLIQPTMDKIFIQKDRDMLLIIPIAVMLVSFMGAAANYGNAWFMRYVGQRLVSDMQTRLFSHLMKSDISLFNTQASGRLISRFTNDINLLRNSFTNVLTALVKGAVTTIFLVGVMVYQNPMLSLFALIVFPFGIYPLMRIGKSMRKISDKTQSQIGDLTVTLNEIFQGVRTVKSYNREAFEARRANTIIEDLCRLYLKGSRKQSAASPMMESLSGISIALVIAYGGFQVMNDQITASAFFSFIAAFLMAYKPVRSMSGMNGTLQEGVAAASRLFSVIDTPPSIADKPDAKPLVIDRGAIAFKGVTFVYEGGAGVSDVTLEVPAGKTAALVGLSGSGKSTLMSLLLRFYDVESGSISIDGQDIRDVTLHSLRDAMAFVPQESVLFDDTVRANIAYGRENASEEEIIQAAKSAAAHDFISSLSEGYDTKIGSHGVRLSGGQRQRLAVARAILKNAPILLLDEATSSLDNESERSIQQSLATLMKDRTTLVIAHRLSTIVGADIIYVIDNGRVIESGSHQSLLAAKGKYFQLYAQNFEG